MTNFVEPNPEPDLVVDSGLLGCGELLVLLHQRMRSLGPGQVMEVVTYDPGAHEDLPAWCRLTGHTMLAEQDTHFFIRKRLAEAADFGQRLKMRGQTVACPGQLNNVGGEPRVAPAKIKRSIYRVSKRLRPRPLGLGIQPPCDSQSLKALVRCLQVSTYVL